MLLLNHISYEAKVLRQYLPPEPFLSASQGSMQRLPDGNIFVGWGAMNHLTEYLDDGTLVFHAIMGERSVSYRAFKSIWTGVPLDPPILWTYAQTKDSQTIFYVTWNGDTETRVWRFYVGANANNSTAFVLAGAQERQGFETRFSIPGYHQWAFAESVAVDGTSLRNSSVVFTWTPGPTLQASCDNWKCPKQEDSRKSEFVPGVEFERIESLKDCQERSRMVEEELEALRPLTLTQWEKWLFVTATAIGILTITAVWFRSLSQKRHVSGYDLLHEEDT